MPSQAATVKEYLAELEPDRRRAIEAVRKTIKANLDPKVKEVTSYGMIGYCIPHSVYPDGYHCNPDQPLPFLNVASQKNHMAVYLFCIYGNDEEIAKFESEWKAAGKKLDMGKSCLRFKKLEDLDLAVLGRAIKRMTVKRFIAHYETALEGTSAGRKRAAKKAAKKVTEKGAKKVAKKAPARKKAPAAKKAVKKKAAKKKASRKKSS